MGKTSRLFPRPMPSVPLLLCDPAARHQCKHFWQVRTTEFMRTKSQSKPEKGEKKKNSLKRFRDLLSISGHPQGPGGTVPVETPSRKAVKSCPVVTPETSPPSSPRASPPTFLQGPDLPFLTLTLSTRHLADRKCPVKSVDFNNHD